MAKSEIVQSVSDKNPSGKKPVSAAPTSSGPDEAGASQSPVLYVYKCAECGNRGEERLPDDSHDGHPSACSACGAAITLEWDGGVTLHADTRRR